MRSTATSVLAFLSVIMIVSAANAKEYVVGVEVPLTGALARVGKANLEGIALGVQVFNQNHRNNSIKIATLDDEPSPAKAIAAVEKLASQGVVAATGGYGTNIVGPASTAAEKAGLAYLTSGGAGSELTARGLKNFVRTNNTEGYAKGIVGLISDMRVKSVSIVYSAKDSTTDLAARVQKSMMKKGVKVAMHPFDPSITDFKPIINKIKIQDRSEVIAMCGYENDYVAIIRAAKVLKPPTVKALVGGWSLATAKMAIDFPDLMPNVYGGAMLSNPVDFHRPEGRTFTEEFNKMYKKAPDYMALYGYVQAQILCEAITRAAEKGAVTRAAVINELRGTNRDTLIGRVRFDQTGDTIDYVQLMGQHQKGRIVIVSPKEMAGGKMNYPALPW